MIKPKTGKCLDCDSGNSETYLMAGRCITAPFFHYQKHKQNQYSANKSKKTKDKAIKLKSINNGLTLGIWFNQQISTMPRFCENCNDYLNPYAPWSARAYIAHIVPKRFFVSVMCHPVNRLFLCIDCHTKFDNSLSREIIKMPVWPLAVERFNALVGNIDPLELRHLQPCFENLTNQ